MALERPHGVRRLPAVSKRDLLFFRSIAVLDLERQISTIELSEAADLEFLAHEGFVESAPGSSAELGSFVWDAFPEENRLVTLGSDDDVSNIPPQILRTLRLGSSGRHPSSFSTDLLPVGGELAVAYALTAHGKRSTAIMNRRPSPDEWRRLANTLAMPPELAATTDDESAIVELVLHSLPVPAEDVPLEDVLDFVRDPQMQRRLDSLSFWVERSSISGQSLRETELELVEGLHEFSHEMEIARLRTERSAVRIIVSCALGVLEEFMHLRPRRALDAALEFRELRASRMEAELAAPGRQLAYIYEARRRFGDREQQSRAN